MYDVGGASSGECFADLVGIGVKVLPQLRCEGFDLLWFKIHDKIDIERGPRNAVG